MKRIMVLATMIIITFAVFGQNRPPVAVNDTMEVFKFDDTLTIMVIDNDYDPEGDKIKVVSAPGSLSKTDSTITYPIPWESFRRSNGIKKFMPYKIQDSAGNYDEGMVYANFHNQFFDSLDINGVNARINNNGNHFWNLEDKAAYFVPKGSSKIAMFAFNIWFGGWDINQQLHLAADRYGMEGQDFFPGPVSNPVYYTNEYDSAWNRLWKISRDEIEYHRDHWWAGGYTPPSVIITWPGNGDVSLGQSAQLAPYHDENDNGIYEPMAGDYPAIKGDQAVFFIMNDNRRLHTESGGIPFGMEIHAMAYAFGCDKDSALWNTVFLHYEFFNRSNYQYNDSYIGTFSDTDLGDQWDDYVGCDIPRSSFYAYNGDAFDGTGGLDSYGAYPPAISTTILGGPYMDPDNLDNPKLDSLGTQMCDLSINGTNFGDGVLDNERYGMNLFMYQCTAGYWIPSNPPSAAAYYNYMKGFLKDGTHMKYGGCGHPRLGSTTVDCNFMFPGMSDPCNWGTNGIQPSGYITGAGGSGISWTEFNEGNAPYDRSGIISMGPFTFAPGAKQELDVAFVWARQFADTSPQAVIPRLGHSIDSIRAYFASDTTPCGGSFSGIKPKPKLNSTLVVYPNPATTTLNIKYHFIGKNPQCYVFDAMGRLLKSEVMRTQDVHQLSISDLPAGVYILIIKDQKGGNFARFIKRK